MVSVIGNTFMATAFLLIGPVPFIPINPTVPLIQGSLAIIGLGYGMVMVSTFGRSQRAAIRKGFNDDMDTYLIISGNWMNRSYYLILKNCNSQIFQCSYASSNNI
jgi:hypothetical protein